MTNQYHIINSINLLKVDKLNELYVKDSLELVSVTKTTFDTYEYILRKRNDLFKWFTLEEAKPEPFKAVLVYERENDNMFCVYIDERGTFRYFENGIIGDKIDFNVDCWAKLPISPELKK